MSEIGQAIETRIAQRDTLAVFFRAHAQQTVQRDELAKLVGENYRSRISECRTELGMVIENVPQFLADGTRTYGGYRFRPSALGREADQIVVYADSHLGPLFDRAGPFQKER